MTADGASARGATVPDFAGRSPSHLPNRTQLAVRGVHELHERVPDVAGKGSDVGIMGNRIAAAEFLQLGAGRAVVVCRLNAKAAT